MSEVELERREFKPQEIIFAQGDDGGEAFLIESGIVEIARKSGDAELIVGSVTTGALIGEMALIDHAPRMATARAMRKTICVVIPKRVFDQILKQSNPILVAVLSTLLRRLRGGADKFARSTLG
ncbi:MAG: cyclic nucleotide-binding domain-containing protein [Proteobacteria bacterium]|nr:cyclic nucleotide-binding domain-containing protein [Pseudomonadota bacterium]